jgi:hypothetical protein
MNRKEAGKRYRRILVEKRDVKYPEQEFLQSESEYLKHTDPQQWLEVDPATEPKSNIDYITNL